MKFLWVLVLLPVCCHCFWAHYYDSLDVHGVAARAKRAADNELGSDSNAHGNVSHGNQTHVHQHHGVHVASWNFDYVKVPLIFCTFWILLSLCKLGFHHAHYLSSVIPESCMLVVLGTICGGIFYALGFQSLLLRVTPTRFFLFILPPIILDSAHSLRDRTFLGNLGTILLYAVVGTLLNCFIIGPVLFALSGTGIMSGLSLTMVECLVFSSLISAVDPVAVLAIFQEIGVNDVLYFLVFGESLLNDAVTVVIYNMMKTFYYMPSIPPSEIGMGIAAFFTVSLGGLSIGLVFGVLTALLTKLTKQVRVAEPMLILLLAYMSYLAAELFHFSGIISMIGCGLLQAQYAFQNIGYKSEISVKYLTKMLSGCSDSLIFLCLGYALVSDSHQWNGWLIFWAIILCTVVRFLVVFFLTFIANKTYRMRKINLEEQFILAYGGLRGAVAFSLVNMLDRDSFQNRGVFETTTLMVVIATIFLQGMSVKPLVKLFRIATAETGDQLILHKIQDQLTDHVTAGMEEVIGQKGGNFFRESCLYYDDRFIKKWLLREPQTKDDIILQAYRDMEMSTHYQHLKRQTSSVTTPKNHDDSESGYVTTRGRCCAGCRRSKKTSPDNIGDLFQRRQSLHQHYDRNLTRDDNMDLWQQLNENSKRKYRFKKPRFGKREDQNANKPRDQTKASIASTAAADENQPIEGTPLLLEQESQDYPKERSAEVELHALPRSGNTTQ